MAKYHPARISRIADGLALAELKLWSKLRVQREDGLNFRRRVLVDGHTVNFLCHKAGVVVQLEDPEAENAGYDTMLHRLIENHGFAVIRVSSKEAEADPHEVSERVLEACVARSPA